MKTLHELLFKPISRSKIVRWHDLYWNWVNSWFSEHGICSLGKFYAKKIGGNSWWHAKERKFFQLSRSNKELNKSNIATIYGDKRQWLDVFGNFIVSHVINYFAEHNYLLFLPMEICLIVVKIVRLTLNYLHFFIHSRCKSKKTITNISGWQKSCVSSLHTILSELQ